MAFVKEELHHQVFNRNDGVKIFFMMDFMCILTKEDKLEQYDMRLLRRDIQGSLFFKDTNKDLRSILTLVSDPVAVPVVFTSNGKMWFANRFMGHIESNLMGI